MFTIKGGGGGLLGRYLKVGEREGCPDFVFLIQYFDHNYIFNIMLVYHLKISKGY